MCSSSPCGAARRSGDAGSCRCEQKRDAGPHSVPAYAVGSNASRRWRSYWRVPSCGCRSPVMRTSRKSSPRARRERPRLTATLEVTRISSPSAVMPEALRNRRARSLLSFSATSSPTGTSTCAVSIRAVTVRARLRATGGRAVVYATLTSLHARDAGWSSPVARWAHNPKVAGSNPAPANPFNRSSIATTVAALRFW